jgi:hypothetical protein
LPAMLDAGEAFQQGAGDVVVSDDSEDSAHKLGFQVKGGR